MDLGCSRGAGLVLDVWLWLPSKVLGHFLQPVTAMLDSLAENTEIAIKEYAEEHTF